MAYIWKKIIEDGEPDYYLVHKDVGAVVLGVISYRKMWKTYTVWGQFINGQTKNFKTLTEAKRYVESVRGIKITRTRKPRTNAFGLDWNLK